MCAVKLLHLGEGIEKKMVEYEIKEDSYNPETEINKMSRESF
jgi:hypothetical protein